MYLYHCEHIINIWLAPAMAKYMSLKFRWQITFYIWIKAFKCLTRNFNQLEQLFCSTFLASPHLDLSSRASSDSSLLLVVATNVLIYLCCLSSALLYIVKVQVLFWKVKNFFRSNTDWNLWTFADLSGGFIWIVKKHSFKSFATFFFLRWVRLFVSFSLFTGCRN